MSRSSEELAALTSLSDESSFALSSLCTTLGAAEQFSPKHLETAEVKKLIDEAKFFYLGGFFLTHGVESAKILAQHAADNNKVRSVPSRSLIRRLTMLGA